MWDELFEDYLGEITKEHIYYWKNDAWQFNYSIDYYSTEAVSSICTELTSTTQS